MIRVGSQRRRGVVIVPVLVCFALILLMTSVLLRIGQTRRAQTLGEERRLQAEWLLEAGLDRARAKLRTDRDYPGETWDIAAEPLESTTPGRVRIAVENDKDHPDRRAVRVEADYPRDDDRRARLSKQVVWELPSKPGGDQP